MSDQGLLLPAGGLIPRDAEFSERSAFPDDYCSHWRGLVYPVGVNSRLGEFPDQGLSIPLGGSLLGSEEDKLRIK